MQAQFERIYAALAPHRRWVVVLACLGLGAAFYRAAVLELDEDITSFLPRGDVVIDDFRFVVEHFRQQDRLFFDVGLDDDSSGSAADVVTAADALASHLEASPLFSEIRYQFSPRQGLELLDHFDRYQSSLFGEEEAQKVEALLQPPALRGRLAEAHRALVEPQGIFLKQAFVRDPLGLREVFLAKLAALGWGSDSAQAAGGRIWTPDQRHLLVIAEPNFSASDTFHGEQVQNVVKAGCQAALTKVGDRGVHIRYAGGPRAALDNRDLIKKDVSRILTLSLCGIVALTFLTFRRRLLVLLCLTPVLWGALFAVAAFSLFSGRISLLISGSGSILVGITVDYAIHLLFRFDNASATSVAEGAIGRHLAPVAKPLLIGALTTCVAFLSLQASLIPGQRQLGVFAALGVAGAALFALLVMPHMLPRTHSKRANPIVPLTRWHRHWSAWHKRRRHGIMVGLLAFTIICIFGLFQVRFDGDFRNLNGVRPLTLADEDHILEHWGAQMAGTSLVLRSPSLPHALKDGARLWEHLSVLHRQGVISSRSSVVPLLPAPELAQANRQRWRTFWDPKRIAALRRSFAREADSLGFSNGAFRSFWEALPESGAPLELETSADLPSGLLGALIGEYLRIEDNQVLLLTRFDLIDPSRLGEVSRDLRAAFDGAALVNGAGLAERTSELVLESLETLALVTFLAVVGILLVVLRRPGLVAAIVVPLGVSVLWTFGVLGWLGVPINLMNSLFVIFIFGTSVDYAVFIATACVRDMQGDSDEVPVTNGAVTISALTTMCGFGALIFARHPAFFSMGVTTLVGAATGLAAAMVLVPLLVPALAGLGPQSGRGGRNHAAERRGSPPFEGEHCPPQQKSDDSAARGALSCRMP